MSKIGVYNREVKDFYPAGLAGSVHIYIEDEAGRRNMKRAYSLRIRW